jgi:oxaloacetate decarboxylase alpha subunit
VDEETLRPISDHLTSIAKREGLPIGKPLEYDVSQYAHQVPGGVISNLKHQLAKLRMDHRLEEVAGYSGSQNLASYYGAHSSAIPGLPSM